MGGGFSRRATKESEQFGLFSKIVSDFNIAELFLNYQTNEEVLRVQVVVFTYFLCFSLVALVRSFRQTQRIFWLFLQDLSR